MTNPITPSNEQTISLSEVPEENSDDTARSSRSYSYSERDINDYFYITIGETVFDQRKGQILDVPYISRITGLQDLAEFVLDDPDGAIRERINEDDEVEIQLGFGDEERYPIMTGVISQLGRKLPDGTFVQVKDFTSQSKNETPRVVVTQTGDEEQEEQFPSDELNNYSSINSRGERRRDTIESSVESKQLNYENNSRIVTDKSGEVVSGEDDLDSGTREAATVGDRVVVDGNTVQRIAPGDGEQTSLVLDYAKNRSVFIGRPLVTKRTNNQPEGSGGSWNVEGWNVDNKSKVRATLVVPTQLNYDSNQIIQILDEELELGSPLYEGSLYTWGDATLGGKRIPEESRIIDRIIGIARVLDELSQEYIEGEKWQIISWYNPNPLGTDGRHDLGDSVDIYHLSIDKIYADLEPKWQGGLALYPSRFMHVDNRHLDDLPPARWEF